jgi:hypothetical protein
MEANVGRRSLQERFESTPLGRILISVFLLVTFVALLTANLPESRLQQVLLDADHVYVYGVALDQSWGVFAPDPRRQTVKVTADIRFADGSHATWHVPRRDPVIGEYSDYRWLKWAEYVVSPAQTQLWKPIALYVARQYATPTRRPTEVSLTNTWHELAPPGLIPEHPFVHRQRFYTTQITDQMLEGS